MGEEGGGAVKFHHIVFMLLGVPVCVALGVLCIGAWVSRASKRLNKGAVPDMPNIPPPSAPAAFGINAETRAILARYFHASPEQIDRMQAVTIEAGNGQFMRATVSLASDEPKEAGQ